MVILLAGAAAASADGVRGFHAAAADGRLWVVRGEPDGTLIEIFTTRIHGPGDAPPALQPVRRLNGRLAAVGAAAAGRRLWLVFDDGPVVRVEAIDVDSPPGRAGATLFRTTPEPRLPARIEPLSLAADDQGLWVLGRARPVADAADDAQADAHAMSGLTLLRLRRSAWEPVDLPRAVADWSPRQAAEHLLTLVSTDGGQRRPVILVSRRGGGDALTLYRAAGHADGAGEADAWDAEMHELAIGRRLQAIAVDGQVIVGRKQFGEDWLTVSLSLLRPQRVMDVGELTLPSRLPPPLCVLASDGRQALLVAAADGGPTDKVLARWTAMNLAGRVTIEAGELRQQPRPPIMADPDFVVLTATLVLASGLLLLIFARREPGAGGPQLAAGLRTADVGRRLLAGLIDLLPWAAAVMLSRGDFDAQRLLLSWPGRSGDWTAMGPAAAVIGLYVAYCSVAELIAGRTLGKLLLGMRVAGIDGRRAPASSIIVRNALKAPDLIAWPLLLLPMFTPLRQRLGDMAAGTVVLMHGPDADAKADAAADGDHDADNDSDRNGDRERDP